MQKFGKFCLENANSWHFDVEISLAKGIIFRKIGLANGAILKQWAAHPCPKFSREPPPPWVSQKEVKAFDRLKNEGWGMRLILGSKLFMYHSKPNLEARN